MLNCCSDARPDVESTDEGTRCAASRGIGSGYRRSEAPGLWFPAAKLNYVIARNATHHVRCETTNLERRTIMAPSGKSLADTDDKILVGAGEQPAWLTLAFANRHGLVTGATGTGKTVSLQVMAEGFARAGVPVFAADIKGDLSGISRPGEAKDFILKRASDLGLIYQA